MTNLLSCVINFIIIPINKLADGYEFVAVFHLLVDIYKIVWYYIPVTQITYFILLREAFFGKRCFSRIHFPWEYVIV